MAPKPGFTEEKSTIILRLQHQVEEATDEQANAQLKVTNSTKALSDSNGRFVQNESNKEAAHKSYQLAESLAEALITAEGHSKKALAQAEKILTGVTKQLEDAYKSALITIDAAQQTMELTRLISKTKVTNKLLSDLLIVDVKNAEADATSAVTDTIAAVSAAILAAQSAILAKQFMSDANDQTINILNQLKNLKNGKALKDRLESYYQSIKSDPLEIESNYKSTEKEVKAASKKLAEAQAHLDLIVKASNAAVAAVSSGS